jgi:hypothetical protein
VEHIINEKVPQLQPIPWREAMGKILATGVVLFALVTPASAATYWVVKDTAAQKCSIMEQDQKPSSPTLTVIGNGYSSQQMAEATIDRAVACGGHGR